MADTATADQTTEMLRSIQTGIAALRAGQDELIARLGRLEARGMQSDRELYGFDLPGNEETRQAIRDSFEGRMFPTSIEALRRIAEAEAKNAQA
jgi:hypothetical protein